LPQSSQSLFPPRISVSAEPSSRAKLAEDEPRCEELRQQKEELKQALFKYRDLQAENIEAVKTLKEDRASLIQQKVCIYPIKLLS
jgi:hypothetical protein